jgi:hypothetical protein
VKSIQKQLHALGAQICSSPSGMVASSKFPLPLPTEALDDTDKLEAMIKADPNLLNMLVRQICI